MKRMLCCHLVSENEAPAAHICSSVRQFLIYSTFHTSRHSASSFYTDTTALYKFALYVFNVYSWLWLFMLTAGLAGVLGGSSTGRVGSVRAGSEGTGRTEHGGGYRRRTIVLPGLQGCSCQHRVAHLVQRQTGSTHRRAGATRRRPCQRFNNIAHRRTIITVFHKIDFMEHSVYVIVRPLSTVGYTSVVASVIHSRQWSN